MAEFQKRIDLANHNDVRLLRDGLPLSIKPTGGLTPLLLIESPTIVDRIALYGMKAEVQQGSLSFPAVASWSLCSGISGDFDDATPLWQGVTNFKSSADLRSRRGFLVKARSVQATTYCLLAAFPLGAGGCVTFLMKGVVDVGGGSIEDFSVGSFAG